MDRIFIGVGSNIQPEENVVKAVEMLAAECRLLGISTFYLTEPTGRQDQPPFFNGILEVETKRPPLELKFSVLRSIEYKLGRVRTEDKYAPRTIDLDILLYGDEVLDRGELILPDPEITSRPFLAVPLGEIAPEVMLPGSGRTLKEIADSMDTRSMKPLIEFTLRLKGRYENQSP